jgi:hypothetical protein
MPRSYLTLSEHPSDMVRLACTKCDRCPVFGQLLTAAVIRA